MLFTNAAPTQRPWVLLGAPGCTSAPAPEAARLCRRKGVCGWGGSYKRTPPSEWPQGSLGGWPHLGSHLRSKIPSAWSYPFAGRSTSSFMPARPHRQELWGVCWAVPGAGPVLGSRATCPPIHVWSGSSLGLAGLCPRTPYARLGLKVLGVLGSHLAGGGSGPETRALYLPS